MSLRNVRAAASRQGLLRARVEPFEPRRLLAASVPADVIGYARTSDAFAGIVADPARNHAFLGRGDDVLVVIDTNTGAQLKTIALAGKPTSLAITPDGASVLVAEPAAHRVEVISTSTLASQRVLNVNVPILQLAGGAGGKFYGLATTDAALASPEDPDVTDTARSVGQFDATTGVRNRTLDLANDEDQFVRTDTSGGRLFIGKNVDDTGNGEDVADVRVFDVSDPSTPTSLASLIGPPARIVDVFADATTGRTYTANSAMQTVELRNADGTVAASWASPFIGDLDERQLTGVVGAAGLPFVFGVFADPHLDQNQTIVAFDAATGVVRHTYTLPDEDGTSAAAVTPNGRVAFVSHDDAATDASTDDANAYTIGIVGATSLSLGNAQNVISGTVFYDVNGDGVRQPGEDGWLDAFSDPPAVLVYADLNNNGKFDGADASTDTAGDEPHAFLDDSNTYRLTMPAKSGTYAVREVVSPFDSEYQRPFVATTATLRMLTLGDGAQAGGVDFGITPGVRIVGTVFADVDGSGGLSYLPGQYDVYEPIVGGAQVYVDLNGDGQHQSNEPISDADPADTTPPDPYSHSYDLVAPANGARVVRLLNPKGYDVTSPGSTAVTIAGVAGTQYTVDFAIRPQLAVAGTLYDDANANGKRDVGELPLVGARVWLDVDGNGKFTKGEPTGQTNATGAYAFAAKERGASLVLARDASARPLAIAQKAHTVRFTDWKQTIGGDLGAYSPATITIRAFVDRDKNRKHNKGDAWLANTIAFIDTNNNGKQDKREPSTITDAEGYATFANLPPGTYVVRLRVSSKVKAKSVPTLTVTLAAGGSRDWAAAVRV